MMSSASSQGPIRLSGAPASAFDTSEIFQAAKVTLRIKQKVTLSFEMSWKKCKTRWTCAWFTYCRGLQRIGGENAEGYRVNSWAGSWKRNAELPAMFAGRRR